MQRPHQQCGGLKTYRRAGPSPPEPADAAQGELDEAVPACHRAHAAGHVHESENEAGEAVP